MQWYHQTAGTNEKKYPMECADRIFANIFDEFSKVVSLLYVSGNFNIWLADVRIYTYICTQKCKYIHAYMYPGILVNKPFTVYE